LEFNHVASRDFFISYTSADRAWAEWIAWELEDAGYTTLIQAWDFRPGMDFVTEMQRGAAESSRTLIVLSQQFLESGFTQAEWTSAFAKDPTGENGLLIPVRVAECEPPGLLRARIYIDLAGLSEEEARRKLLDGVKQERAKPATRPPIPTSATQKPRLPVAIRRTTHNLPFRPNPLFTGRGADMERLGKLLEKHGEVDAIQIVILHGLGGVGKTQLAVEYAWKHLNEYDSVFWVKADSRENLEANLAGLAQALGLPEASAKQQSIQMTLEAKVAGLAQARGLPEASAKEQSIRMDAVLRWLGGHERWLLIADNADSEVAARTVRERFVPNLRGHVLVTSQLSRWPVTMPNLPLDTFLPEDAARFLLDRVAKEGHNGGDEAAARLLAHEVGCLPLALEQAAAFITEVRWSFERYHKGLRDARPELLSYRAEGGSDYPESVAKTWSITLERLSPLARALLRIAAWYGPDDIARGVFSADHSVLSEALGQHVELSDIAIEKALAELERFSLVRLTSETVSVHRLLQAVEQDSLPKEDCKRWLAWAARLFNGFAPQEPDDVRTWGLWLPLSAHAETLIEHTKRQGVDTLPVALVANQFGLFLNGRAAYAQAEPLLTQTYCETCVGRRKHRALNLARVESVQDVSNRVSA
jgi:hypothetical protein